MTSEEWKLRRIIHIHEKSEDLWEKHNFRFFDIYSLYGKPIKSFQRTCQNDFVILYLQGYTMQVPLGLTRLLYNPPVYINLII